jgi:hypothetical protein
MRNSQEIEKLYLAGQLGLPAATRLNSIAASISEENLGVNATVGD